MSASDANHALQGLLKKYSETNADGSNSATVVSEGYQEALKRFIKKNADASEKSAVVTTGSSSGSGGTTSGLKSGVRRFGKKPSSAATTATVAATTTTGPSHWSEKSLDKMQQLDWTNLRSTFSISISAKNTSRALEASLAAATAAGGSSTTTSGASPPPQLLTTNNAPFPLRCWGELPLYMAAATGGATTTTTTNSSSSTTTSPPHNHHQWIVDALQSMYPFPTSIQMQSVAASLRRSGCNTREVFFSSTSETVSNNTTTKGGEEEGIVQGSDVMAIAETGSGKTLAYLVSALAHLARNDLLIDFTIDTMRRGPRVLVLVPNRELGIQVHQEIEKFFNKFGPKKVSGTKKDEPLLRAAVAVGGENEESQHEKISKGVHFLVASPGQAIKLYKKGFLSFENTKCVIIDEADTMVDDGLSDQLVDVLIECPEERQTLLFTATMLPELERISSTYLTPSYYLVSTPYRFARTDQRFFLFPSQLEDKAEGGALRKRKKKESKNNKDNEEVEDHEVQEEDSDDEELEIIESSSLHSGKMRCLLRVLEEGFPPLVSSTQVNDDVGEKALAVGEDNTKTSTTTTATTITAPDSTSTGVDPEVATVPVTKGPIIIFVNSKETANHIEEYLKIVLKNKSAKAAFGEAVTSGVEKQVFGGVAKLHSDMKQEDRKKVILSFRRCGELSLQLLCEGNNTTPAATDEMVKRKIQDEFTKTTQFVVTTDMLARGLDIPNIQLVVNFDMPRPTVVPGSSAAPTSTTTGGESGGAIINNNNNKNDAGEKALVRFIHRIGRTARAGREGAVLSFITLNPSVLGDAFVDEMEVSDEDDDDNEEEEDNHEGDGAEKSETQTRRGKRGREADGGDKDERNKKKDRNRRQKRKNAEKNVEDDRKILRPLLKMLKGCTHPSTKEENIPKELHDICKQISSDGRFVGNALVSSAGQE